MDCMTYLEILQILSAHQNEVWFVQFSNNGDYLASSSSDCTAIIWKVNIMSLIKLILRRFYLCNMWEIC